MVIEIQGVTLRRGGRTVLDDLNLTLTSAVTTVMGVNGSGKSSLMLAVIGLLPFEGVVKIDGQRVDPGRPQWLDRRLGYAPQSVNWPARATPRGLCEVAAYLRRVPRGEVADAVASAVESSGVARFADQQIRTLSGGQRRRVALAQALVHGPGLIVLDEPTSELDPAFGQQFAQTVAALSVDRQLLISTHAIDDAVAWGGDVVVLGEGSVTQLRGGDSADDLSTRIKQAFAVGITS